MGEEQETTVSILAGNKVDNNSTGKDSNYQRCL